MVWKKEGILFGLAILLIVFFNFNLVKAGTMCADNQIILKLSSSTNAHGEVWNGAGGYTTEICYDRVFGTLGNGDRTCSGSNKVVGLSASTNAHAEAPNQSNYQTNICYGGLNCVARPGGCLSGENLTLTLSSNTNAHLSNGSSYPVSICCTAPAAPPAPCTIDSALWNVNQTVAGNTVHLDVTTTNCQGLGMSFVIKEFDFPGGPLFDDSVNTNPSNVVVASDGTAVGNWVAEWQPESWPETDPPEYYFTATILNGTGQNIQSSNQLKVYQQPPAECSNIVTCSDYGDQQSCQGDVCSVAKNSVPSSVDCNAPNAACACSWNANTSVCEGSWRIDNPPPQTDVGTCFYTESTTGTCQGNSSNGFLTVTWLSRWEWSSENPGQNDTQGLQAECLSANGSTDSLACPAQIPLPFFGPYNLVAALVLVAIIYLVLNMRRRKTKKR